jgi:hypothetical protein
MVSMANSIVNVQMAQIKFLSLKVNYGSFQIAQRFWDFAFENPEKYRQIIALCIALLLIIVID